MADLVLGLVLASAVAILAVTMWRWSRRGSRGRPELPSLEPATAEEPRSNVRRIE